MLARGPDELDMTRSPPQPTSDAYEVALAALRDDTQANLGPADVAEITAASLLIPTA